MDNLFDLINAFGDLVGLAIPIVGSLALLGFFWGLAKYIFSQGNETSKIEGKKVMVYGLIALFVMFSVWGIIGFFQRSFGFRNNGGIIQIRSV